MTPMIGRIKAVETPRVLDLHWLTGRRGCFTRPRGLGPWKANLVELLVGRTHSVLVSDEVVIEPLLDDVAEDCGRRQGRGGREPVTR